MTTPVESLTIDRLIRTACRLVLHGPVSGDTEHEKRGAEDVAARDAQALLTPAARMDLSVELVAGLPMVERAEVMRRIAESTGVYFDGAFIKMDAEPLAGFPPPTVTTTHEADGIWRACDGREVGRYPHTVRLRCYRPATAEEVAASKTAEPQS